MSEELVDRWLSLSEASTLLGVHASTLRRWADSGRVPCQRTPGGHRRFSLARLRPLVDGSGYSPARDLDPALAGIQSWHLPFEDAGLVAGLRELGQQLSGVLMQFLLRSDADERYLAQAFGLGQRYAGATRAARIGLLEAVRAFVFYRSAFVELLPLSASLDPAGNIRLFARYEQFMGEVLLGLVAGFVDDPRRNGHS
jgi:excisionase family DNA binding protein